MVEPPAERRIRVVAEQVAADVAGGHDAVGVHQGGGRAAGVGPVRERLVHREPFGGIGVGDDGAVDAGGIELVAEQAGLGAERRAARWRRRAAPTGM